MHLTQIYRYKTATDLAKSGLKYPKTRHIYSALFILLPHMSYKHNNLMAMRQNYWNNDSTAIHSEKLFLIQQLSELQVFNSPTLDDAKYLFFSLPSIVIVKGYAHGFTHDSVRSMITDYIQTNKAQLSNKAPLKIKFRM